MNQEEVMQAWARLAGPLRHLLGSGESERLLEFQSSFARLIESAKEIRDIEFRELHDVVERSRTRLMPLGEPLELDVGLHRWLAGAREETYSDWLQWLFAQMTGADLACVLNLAVNDELEPDILREKVRVDREVWVEHGHEGRLGRLDILVHMSNRAVVAIEVKLGSASDADTAKQSGYFASIEGDPEFKARKRFYVLLVTTGINIAQPEDKSYEFEVREYAKFCRNLRRLVTKWVVVKENLLVVALSLMVTAAIENNLLHLSIQKNSFTPATLFQLSQFLEESNYE